MSPSLQSERHNIPEPEAVESFRKGIRQIYPDIDFKEAVRQDAMSSVVLCGLIVSVILGMTVGYFVNVGGGLLSLVFSFTLIPIVGKYFFDDRIEKYAERWAAEVRGLGLEDIEVDEITDAKPPKVANLRPPWEVICRGFGF